MRYMYPEKYQNIDEIPLYENRIRNIALFPSICLLEAKQEEEGTVPRPKKPPSY